MLEEQVNEERLKQITRELDALEEKVDDLDQGSFGLAERLEEATLKLQKEMEEEEGEEK